MAFNISEISSVINGKGGLMKPSKFYVTITRPLSLGSGDDERTLPFLCEATQLPGVALTLESTRPLTYDAEQKRPNGVNFTDISLTFYADNSGTIFNYFHRWIHYISNFSQKQSNQYLMEYPDKYRGTLNLYVLDVAQNQVLTYTMYEAFPYQVDPIPVSWGDSDQIVRFNATFTFSYWNSSSLTNVSEAHQFNIETNTTSSNQTVNLYPAYSYNYSNPVLNPFYIASNPILQTASAVGNIVNVFSRLF